MVQATFLFCIESWVMFPWIGRTLGSFHHRLDQRLEKFQPNKDVAGRLLYLPLDAAMKAVGMEQVEMYVLRFQNTAAHYIPTWAILELYLAAEKSPGAQVLIRWWEQAVIDLGHVATGMEMEMEEDV